jgi:hypothetical protein
MAGQWLYERYLQCLSNYARHIINPVLTNAFLNDSDTEFLACWVREWIRYKMLCITLNACFRYLDKFLVWKRFLPSLEEASFNIFKTVVFKLWRGRLQTVISSQLLKLHRQSLKPWETPNVQNALHQYVEASLEELDERTSNPHTKGRLMESFSASTQTQVALELSFDHLSTRLDQLCGFPVEISQLIVDYSRECADPAFTVPLSYAAFKIGKSLTVKYSEGRIYCNILAASKDAVQVRAQYDSGLDDIAWISKFSPRIIVD